MVLYVLSCRECEFSASATDLRGLGSEINTHGSNCDGKPLVALKKEQDQANRGSEAPGEIQTSPDREMQQVRSCA